MPGYCSQLTRRNMSVTIPPGCSEYVVTPVPGEANYMGLSVADLGTMGQANTVADPGFPRGRCADCKGGGANLPFCPISLKNYMKIMYPRGMRIPGAPLGSTNVLITYLPEICTKIEK